MDATTLSELRKPRTYPAVSVLMPMRRAFPGDRRDPGALRGVLAEVRRMLRDDDRVTPDAAEEVVRGLERAAGEVDPHREAEGVALFAAPGGEHHAFTIGQPVDERIIVDSGFATRDLVAEHTRTPRYWLLCLSGGGARLWDGRDGRLAEHARDGFPVVPGQGDAEGEAGDERLREVVRAAADAAERVLARDRRPLIVASGIRGQALFDEQAGPHVTVAGRVHGDFEGASPATLAEAARPALAAYEDLREVGVLSELEAARRIDRYASGLLDVSRLVEEGRGEHLVVERGYYAPAVRPRGGEGGADVGGDAVDDVIATTLDYGGEVTFVSDGFLVDHGRIALVTRY